MGRQRSNNEDAWLIAGHLRLAVVADGMGGEACGEVASAITIRTIESVVSGAPPEMTPLELLRTAVRAANECVVEEASRKTACAGMGSTVVAARWEGSRLDIVSVGDSRAYLYRDGHLTQLTYDQNLGNELRDSMGWSEEQISRFPQRHVLTAAIGANANVLMREATLEMADRDWILLCSDGLYGPAGDGAISLLLSVSASMAEAVDNLILAANQAGGPDNITVVLLEYRA
jgi:protein phosphatase